MHSDVAIRVSGIGKRFRRYDSQRARLLQLVRKQPLYREFTALEDVSFTVSKGETVAIVGRNGSGKSTLLQIICGTLTPSQGEVAVNGRVAALLELGAGFNPEFSGRENVYMNASVLGLDDAQTTARFAAIEAFADIGDFIDQPVKTYSSGMLVRLAFAVAINVEPQILVVDEALAVGDELFQRKCYAKIEEIKARGATILFVSHASNTVLSLCDRAILLEGGRKLTEGHPKRVIAHYQRLLNAPADKAALVRDAIVADEAPVDAHAAVLASSLTEDRFDPHLLSPRCSATSRAGR